MSDPIRLRSRMSVAVLLFPMAFVGPPAHAGGIDTLSCGGSWNFFSCVRRFDSVPPKERGAAEARDEAEAADRERQWLARCRPAVRQDRYGVGRYVYSAPGCEYGRTQD